jgi:hypothetical protein
LFQLLGPAMELMFVLWWCNNFMDKAETSMPFNLCSVVIFPGSWLNHVLTLKCPTICT